MLLASFPSLTCCPPCPLPLPSSLPPFKGGGKQLGKGDQAVAALCVVGLDWLKRRLFFRGEGCRFKGGNGLRSCLFFRLLFLFSSPALFIARYGLLSLPPPFFPPSWLRSSSSRARPFVSSLSLVFFSLSPRASGRSTGKHKLPRSCFFWFVEGKARWGRCERFDLEGSCGWG